MPRTTIAFGTEREIPGLVRSLVAESEGDREVLMAIARAASLLSRTSRNVDPRLSGSTELPDVVHGMRSVSKFGTMLTALMDADDADAGEWVMDRCSAIAGRQGMKNAYEMAVTAGEAMGHDLMRAAAARSTAGVHLLRREPGPRHDSRYHAYRLLDAITDPRVNAFIEMLVEDMAAGRGGASSIVRKTAEIGMISVPSDLHGAGVALRRIRCTIEAWMASRGALYDFTGMEQAIMSWQPPMPASCMASSGCRYIHMGEASPRGWEGAFLLGRDVRLDGFPDGMSEATTTLLLMPTMPIHEDDHVGSTMRAIMATLPVRLHDYDDVDRAAARAVEQGTMDEVPGRSLSSLHEMIAVTLRAMSHLSRE